MSNPSPPAHLYFLGDKFCSCFCISEDSIVYFFRQRCSDFCTGKKHTVSAVSRFIGFVYDSSEITH